MSVFCSDHCCVFWCFLINWSAHPQREATIADNIATRWSTTLPEFAESRKHLAQAVNRR